MDSLLATIAQLYGVEAHFVEKVSKGFLTENFVLADDSKKFFLKKYRFTRKERIEEIHSAKQFFADSEIPVILPIFTIGGDTFFEHEGKYYTLFPFIDALHYESGRLPREAAHSLGEMLGKIHVRGKESTLVVGNEDFHPWNKEDTLKKIDQILEIIKNSIGSSTDFDRDALQCLSFKRKCIENNTVTFEELGLRNDHLIHGDYFAHNVFFNDRHEVIYVFDFEKTEYAPRVHELFRCLTYTFLSEKKEQEDLDLAKTYLRAYTAVYPMSNEEIKKGILVAYLKSVHSLWVESEHYLNNNTRVDSILTNDIRRNAYLTENLDYLCTFLTS